MSTIVDLPKRVTVKWSSRIILVNERVSFEAVHLAVKSSFFYLSKFMVPTLSHSANPNEVKNGAPILRRLVLDEGWEILGDDLIYNAIKFKTTYKGRNGKMVTQVVLEPCQAPSMLNNLIA